MEDRIKAKSADEFEVRLEEMEGKSFDGKLSEIADFDWDRVGFFTQYSSAKRINRDLGFEAAVEGFSLTEEYLFVFVKDGKVARAAQFHWFAPIAGPAVAGRSVRLVVSPDKGFQLVE